MTEQAKKKMGRPSGLDKVDLTEIEDLSRSGKTDAQIAAHLGITTTTLYRWKQKSNDFREAINKWKEVADDKVEASLLERALGYSHEETKVQVVDGQVVRTTITKHHPPDTAAAIFWLKNRRRDQWRDKQEIEHSGAVDLASQIIERRNRLHNRLPVSPEEN